MLLLTATPWGVYSDWLVGATMKDTSFSTLEPVVGAIFAMGMGRKPAWWKAHLMHARKFKPLPLSTPSPQR